MKRALVLAVALLTLTALVMAMGSKEAPERKSHAADSTAVRQGISGRVEIWEGNFMPMVDPVKAAKQVRPAIGRRVRAHLPVKMDGSLATAKRDSIPTALVAETVTDSSGAFFMPTPAGSYSVFVEEAEGWYFNGWNGDGIQGAVTVDSGKSGEILIKITTKAIY
jgi:hypothetical protein